jgi:hypothetical protein
MAAITESSSHSRSFLPHFSHVLHQGCIISPDSFTQTSFCSMLHLKKSRAEEAHDQTRFRLRDSCTGHSLLSDTHFWSGEIALRAIFYGTPPFNPELYLPTYVLLIEGKMVYISPVHRYRVCRDGVRVRELRLSRARKQHKNR